MTISLRPWRPEDYAACEALVNQAWNFDAVFAPPALAAASDDPDVLVFTSGQGTVTLTQAGTATGSTVAGSLSFTGRAYTAEFAP